MKNEIDFMLYSYFKITTDDGKETILKGIISKAYDDATMQGAYNVILPPEFKQKSDETKSDVAKNILSGLQFDIFKNNFDPIGIMDTIKDIYDKNVNGYSEFFAFGNAQKWVNMSIKYILVVNALISAVNSKHEFCKIGNKFEEKKSQFDLPVDSYMLEAMWSNKDIEIPTNSDRKGKYSPDKVKPWSKWNKDEYIKFRESLHKAIECPLDWEGPAWIEISRKRSDK